MDAGAGSGGATTFLSGGLPPQYGSGLDPAGLDPAGLDPAGLDPAGFPPKHADAIIPAASAVESSIRRRVLGLLDMPYTSLKVNGEDFAKAAPQPRNGLRSCRWRSRPASARSPE